MQNHKSIPHGKSNVEIGHTWVDAVKGALAQARCECKMKVSIAFLLCLATTFAQEVDLHPPKDSTRQELEESIPEEYRSSVKAEISEKAFLSATAEAGEKFNVVFAPNAWSNQCGKGLIVAGGRVTGGSAIFKYDENGRLVEFRGAPYSDCKEWAWRMQRKDELIDQFWKDKKFVVATLSNLVLRVSTAQAGAAGSTLRAGGRGELGGGGLRSHGLGSLRARRQMREDAERAEREAERAAQRQKLLAIQEELRKNREAEEARKAEEAKGREDAERAERAEREAERAAQRQQLLAIQEELRKNREAERAAQRQQSLARGFSAQESRRKQEAEKKEKEERAILLPNIQKAMKELFGYEMGQKIDEDMKFGFDIPKKLAKPYRYFDGCTLRYADGRIYAVESRFAAGDKYSLQSCFAEAEAVSKDLTERFGFVFVIEKTPGSFDAGFRKGGLSVRVSCSEEGRGSIILGFYDGKLSNKLRRQAREKQESQKPSLPLFGQ